MGSDWPKLRLDEVTDLIVDCSHSTPKWTESGVIVLRSQYIKNGRLSLSNPSFTTEDGYLDRIKRAVPSAGDIVLTREAPMGEVCIVPKNLKCCLGQRMVLLRANEDMLDSEYLLYVLQSPFLQHQISWNEGTGTTVSNIRIPSIKAFQIPIPEISLQKRIANILSTIDNKIELNRQTNETLEKMAKALFKSWFVDFDPVIDNALAAGNTIPDELQDRAARRQQQLAKPDHQPLPDAIRQLFPSEFELTEALGWVPMGWEIKSINDLAQVIKGKSYKSSELKESKTALVTLRSFMRGGGYRLDGIKEYTGKYKPEQEVFAGDLVIAYTDVTQAADVIGKPAMVISDARYEHLVISLDVAVVRPEKNNYKYFLYGLAQTEKFQEHTHSHSTGTTVLHLGKTAVPEYSFAKPSDETLGVYINIVKPKYRSIDANIQNSRALEKLRDTLLPKLISGELRLPPEAPADAEQQPANATS